MQDIIFYSGAVVTCILACLGYYLKSRAELERAEKSAREAARKEELAEKRQQVAEVSAKQLSEDIRKLSLEKDAALADLRNAQQRFAEHAEYSAELDDRIKSFAFLFAFQETALDDPTHPFSALISGSTFGGYFGFTATPQPNGPFDQPGMSLTLNCWNEGMMPDEKPRNISSLLPIPDPKTIILDFTTIFAVTGKGPKTLRELHGAAIQLFLDQRSAGRVKRFGIAANGRLILDVVPELKWWRHLKPEYPVTERGMKGVLAAEFESRPIEKAIGPCLRIDLHSKIPPRLPQIKQ